MLITIGIILHTALNIAAKYSAPVLYYDRARYQYEDSLIRGDIDNQRDQRHREVEDMIRVQPLNYRLPSVPTVPPSFSSPAVTNLTVMLDTTVVLGCRVTNIGSSVSVSWLRAPQLTVLSSGPYIFSSSRRLSLLHDADSPDYNLQISRVRMSDAGQYLCQINTQEHCH